MSHAEPQSGGRSEREEALRRAKRLEWATFLFTVSSVTLTFFVLGGSQAMQTAWIEDLLSMVPPVAFLITTQIARRPATRKYPYGYHRASAVAHLVSASALTVVGAFLIFDGASVLLASEHPPIGTIELFGHGIWQGWVMIAAMAYGGSVPAVLGRMKLKPAATLHDKAVYADADMNKAEWKTAAAAIVGIVGIGLGLWWADAVAAMAISLSIIRDGITNLRGSVRDLMDGEATTVDNSAPLPLTQQVHDQVIGTPWVQDARIRIRDMGQRFSIDARVKAEPHHTFTTADIRDLRREIEQLDETIHDVTITPLTDLPGQ